MTDETKKLMQLLRQGKGRVNCLLSWSIENQAADEIERLCKELYDVNEQLEKSKRRIRSLNYQIMDMEEE